MPSYRISNQAGDLEGILRLQQLNLTKAISPEEAREQGFVTLVHDLPLLAAMNTDYGHSIAVQEEEVVGYALMSQRKFEAQLPALGTMMKLLDQVHWQGRPLRDYRYFIMGQVCVAKAFRGQGVFAGLYDHLCTRLSTDFDCIVTDIATHNTRSMRAHLKIGFEEIHRYQNKDGVSWVIVGKSL